MARATAGHVSRAFFDRPLELYLGIYANMMVIECSRELIVLLLALVFLMLWSGIDPATVALFVLGALAVYWAMRAPSGCGCQYASCSRHSGGHSGGSHSDCHCGGGSHCDCHCGGGSHEEEQFSHRRGGMGRPDAAHASHAANAAHENYVSHPIAIDEQADNVRSNKWQPKKVSWASDVATVKGAPFYPGAIDIDDNGEALPYGHPDRGAWHNAAAAEGNPFALGRLRPDVAAGAEYDDEANDDELDGDERMANQGTSRNDATRVTAGTMNRRGDVDKYLREEVEEAQDRVWWGRHEL